MFSGDGAAGEHPAQCHGACVGTDQNQPDGALWHSGGLCGPALGELGRRFNGKGFVWDSGGEPGGEATELFVDVLEEGVSFPSFHSLAWFHGCSVEVHGHGFPGVRDS